MGFGTKSPLQDHFLFLFLEHKKRGKSGLYGATFEQKVLKRLFLTLKKEAVLSLFL